ncbi:tetratricopeptide repeat protein [Fulvivirgaceae bacterium BMA10]|uniref:histidine kinase n=1 Tax=Splendidivirga corallicola TaxID=3051826 RepID=A0ABT8L1Y7_9BACT|nr:tetratricopeptide repeat protein [Fulvivirgaceae bacterium BMA10]
MKKAILSSTIIIFSLFGCHKKKEDYQSASFQRIQNLIAIASDIPAEEAIDSLRLALTLVEDPIHDSIIGEIYNKLGSRYIRLKNYDSSLIYFQKSSNIYQSFSDSAGIAKTFNNIGAVFQRLNVYDSAFFYYLQAGDLYKILGDSARMSISYRNLSTVLRRAGTYERALKLVLNSLLILEESNNPAVLSDCYTTVGNIYKDIEDFWESIVYHRKSLEICVRINDRDGIAESYNNIGTAYQRLEALDSALFYYNQALNIKKSIGDSGKLASTINNIGEINFEMGNLEIAESNYLESLELKKNALDQKGIAVTSINLARLYILQKRHDLAANYLDKSIEISKETKSLEYLQQAYALYKELYISQKRFGEAIHYYDLQTQIRDSILNDAVRKEAMRLQKEYEIDKREQKIAFLNNETILRDKIIESRNTQITMLIIVGILLLLLVVISFNLYLLKRKANQRIETLMRELHHRVKNNLQILSTLLSLQSEKLKDSEAKRAVKRGENRVNAMALIHQNLYLDDKLSDINMKEYIGKLIQNLRTSYGFSKEEVQLNVDVQDLNLDVDKAIPLGLIVNELASNSFKYALVDNPDPIINISLKQREDKKLELNIADNGTVKKDQLELENAESFGLKLVQLLTRQLKASLNINTDHGVSHQLIL